MRNLLLLRHAKSNWSDPGQLDHERPLNDRGKHDARRMGQWIKELDLLPDLIVSSSAKRARKTARKVANQSGYEGRIELEGELYQAFPEQYISVVQRVDDQHHSLLIVAHNPGLEDFLHWLTGQSERMPTASLAHILLDIDRWSDLIAGRTGQLLGVWRPKELD